MKTPTAEVALRTEVIARTTAAQHTELALFAIYDVARRCYGSLENYVSLMETQLRGTSAYQVWYGNEGYAILKTAHFASTKLLR